MRRAGSASSDRRRRLQFVAVACLAAAAGCAPTPGMAGEGQPAPIRRAGILLTGGDTPPPDDAPWQGVTLPDDWSRTRRSVSGDAWYRLEFELAARDVGLSVVYVPRLSMMGVPYVNGTPVAYEGRFTEPLRRLWYRPQLHWIPATLLRPATNVLHYRIRAYPDNQGGLSEVYVGRPEALVAAWRSHVFWQVTAMQATTGITAALGLLVLVAWAVLRWHSAYGYFAMAALCWTLHSVLVLAVDIPVPALYWEVLIAASLMWVAVAMMMFALRFAGLRRPWLERGAWAYALLAPVLLWAADLGDVFGVANGLLFVLLVIGAYEFKILFGVARRAPSAESLLLVGAALFVLGLGAHDWLNRRGTLAYAEPFNMHYGVPVLFLAVFWNLIGQVATARRATEDLNRDLEVRVARKAEALERSHERLREAHASEALAAERERIMRDMHDGVGSQLIAAREIAGRGTLTSAELATLLDECIDDLRLMIDSLEPTEGDLLTVLGNLRYRLTDRLARQGVKLTWAVAELPASGLGASAILQVLRIVQEAFANLLKHSGATEAVFSAALAPDGRHIVLSVRDTGRGLPDGAAPQGGRGLGNMRQRAAAVGGTLRVEGGGGNGCLVLLTLPRPPHTTAAASDRSSSGTPSGP